MAHYQVGLAAYFQGRFAESVEHTERAAELYEPEAHGGGRSIIGSEPGVVARLWAAWALWVLGHAERALERSREAIALASQRGEPFDLAYAKSWGAALHLLRREYAAANELAQQAAVLAEEQGFPIQLAVARLVELRVRASQEGSEGRIEGAESHFGQLGQLETKAAVPQILGELAEACLGQGRREEALRLVDGGLEASKNLSQPYWDAELHRLKGEILQQDDAPGAEALMRRAVDIAKQQGGRSLELRAATSLARMLRASGRAAEARSVLAPVHASFTEGFTTADLRDAAALLEDLPAA
jgi:tetratricopeptide (TPR) repeat protein